MDGCLHNALYLREINAKAQVQLNVSQEYCPIGSGIAARDSEWPDFVVGSQSRAAREASRQLLPVLQEWAQGWCLENGFGRDKFLVKTAEDEQLVLHHRSANGEPGEFIIQPRLLGQVIACCIGAQSRCFWKLFSELRIELFSFP